MADDIDKTIQENLNFTMELANTIILDAGEDPHDAFITADRDARLDHLHHHARGPEKASPERRHAVVETVFEAYWMWWSAHPRIDDTQLRNVSAMLVEFGLKAKK